MPEKTYAELAQELLLVKQKLGDADRVMLELDILIQRGQIGSRSGVADARLEYGAPYEYLNLRKETLEEYEKKYNIKLT